MKTKIITLSLGILLLSSYSFAATLNPNTEVTAAISNSCQFIASDVNFGIYNPYSSTHLETTQYIDIKCTKNTSYKLNTFANESINTALGMATFMKIPGRNDRLLYQIYEPHWWERWDQDMDGGGQTFQGIGNGEWEKHPFLYRIIKNQYVFNGEYSDTQTVKLTF